MNSIIKKVFDLKNNRTIYKGFLFTIFSFLNTGINFILLLVLSKFLTPAEYGYLNLFNTFILLMMIFISFNAEKIIVVNFYNVSHKYTGETIVSVLLFSLVLFFIYSVITIIFASKLESYFGFSYIYVLMAIAYCYLSIYSYLNLTIWKAEDNPKSYGLYSVSLVLCNCIGTILLLVVFKMGWVSRALAQFMVAFSFFVFSIFFLLRKGYFSKKILPQKDKLKEALQFGLPLVPFNLSWWAIQGINRFIINGSYGAVEVGLYSFATNFSNIIQIIGTSFVQSYHVDVFKNLAENGQDCLPYYARFTKRMIFFYFIISCVIYILCLFLIPIFFPSYKDSLSFLLPLCIGALAHCINQLFVCYLYYNKRTSTLMRITIVTSILNVIFGVVYIKYNLLAAAYISMFSEFAIMISYIYYAQKLMNYNFFK